MDLATARQSVADALNTVSGLKVKPRPFANPKAGDGWVNVGAVAPSSTNYRSCDATLTVVIILGGDQRRAETRMEEISTACVNAVTTTLYCDGVRLEPVDLVMPDMAASFYALTLTLTVEVN